MCMCVCMHYENHNSPHNFMLPWRWNLHYPWIFPLLPRHPYPLPAGWAPSPGRSSGSLSGWLDPDTHHSSLCLLEQGQIPCAVDCEIICEVLWPFTITLKSLSSGLNTVGPKGALLRALHLLLHCSTISLAQILWLKFHPKRKMGKLLRHKCTSVYFFVKSDVQLWEEDFTCKCKKIDSNILRFKQRLIFWLWKQKNTWGTLLISHLLSKTHSWQSHWASGAPEFMPAQITAHPWHQTNNTKPTPYSRHGAVFEDSCFLFSLIPSRLPENHFVAVNAKIMGF